MVFNEGDSMSPFFYYIYHTQIFAENANFVAFWNILNFRKILGK